MVNYQNQHQLSIKFPIEMGIVKRIFSREANFQIPEIFARYNFLTRHVIFENKEEYVIYTFHKIWKYRFLLWKKNKIDILKQLKNNFKKVSYTYHFGGWTEISPSKFMKKAKPYFQIWLYIFHVGSKILIWKCYNKFRFKTKVLSNAFLYRSSQPSFCPRKSLKEVFGVSLVLFISFPLTRKGLETNFKK